jgi:PAS domain S-box-containing protein
MSTLSTAPLTPPPSARPALVRYGVAVGVSVLALALNLLLAFLLRTNTFPPFLAAVMVGTWFGGLGPGLVAATLTSAANNYFFVSPGTVAAVDSASSIVHGLVYVLSALLIVALAARLRSTQERAEASGADARRHAESLREREEQLRSLLEGVKDYAIIMLDPDGRVTSWNAGAERITGYPEAEILGEPFSRFYRASDVAAGEVTRALAAAARTGRFENQGWGVRRDETQFWADVVITPVRDQAGRLRGFSTVTRDITERRRAEEAVRASESKLRGVLDLAPDAIVIVNADGRIVLANGQAQQLFKYSLDELTGQPVEVLLPSEVREAHVAHRAAFDAEPRRRPMGLGLELSARRKDGSTFPVEISLSPMPSDDGPLVISAIRDISDRKQAQARIKALNEDLERRVNELAALNRELESFSYSVSHDLRAPLRSIDGFSQALLEESGEALDEQGRDYLRRVRAAASRMGDLIDDLLNLSRVTRRELRHERVDLTEMAQGIVAQLRKADPERRAEFRIADAMIVHGDAHLLRVGLENLLGNAWKFTSKEPLARIEFGTMRLEGRRVHFIRDNGVGFDMAYSSKLFGAFQRLHRASEFPGTGIGLATVHRIIARHGGRVWTEAEVGKGAVFYFTL